MRQISVSLSKETILRLKKVAGIQKIPMSTLVSELILSYLFEMTEPKEKKKKSIFERVKEEENK